MSRKLSENEKYGLKEYCEEIMGVGEDYIFPVDMLDSDIKNEISRIKLEEEYNEEYEYWLDGRYMRKEN